MTANARIEAGIRENFGDTENGDNAPRRPACTRSAKRPGGLPPGRRRPALLRTYWNRPKMTEAIRPVATAVRTTSLPTRVY